MAESTPPEAPPVDGVAVTIDGTEVVARKGELVIDAAERNGVYIPRFCYHPRMKPVGMCRMCLVEIDTGRGPALQPSCMIECTPDMKVDTASEVTRKAQEGVLEFLLINHPLDCPICDQAGECKLQEYSVEFGQSASRFVEAKVHKPKAVDLGPRIMLDDERCILCTRCIRFTRDIVGDDKLGIVNRGSYNTIAAYPGTRFDNNYTLNTVDICPVGALTSKDFRFQMRVWFLKETKSLCASCGTGCNILVGSREGKVHRFTPRDNDAVNGSWMCDTGRLNYKWIDREDRLREVRSPRSEVRSWTAVIAALGAKLSATPPGSVAIIASARQTNEELFLLKKLATKLGAITDSVPREGEADQLLVAADKNPNTNGARLNGICFTEIGIKLPDIARGIREGRIQTLIVFGEDVTKHGVTAEDLAKLELLVVSDILPNATTAAAHYVLPGCAHVEKRGSFTNTKGRVQKFMKAVEPPGDARPESEFLRELVVAVKGEAVPATIEGLFNQMAREVSEFGGLTWAGLGDAGKTVKV